MSRTTAVIVDDEPLARRRLRELLDGIDWIACVGEAADGDAAVAVIDDRRPHLVFLDIELPGFSGIEVLRRCRCRPAVIFTTAFDRYAVTAFELEAVDYLLKPFGRERLDAALRSVRLMLGRGDADALERAERASTAGPSKPIWRLFVRDRGRIVPIAMREVERFEAEDDYVRVCVGGRGHLIHVPLQELESRLDPGRFVRVHRRHIVNLDHVAWFRSLDDSRLEVHMKDGSRVVASRSRSKDLRERVV